MHFTNIDQKQHTVPFLSASFIFKQKYTSSKEGFERIENLKFIELSLLIVSKPSLLSAFLTCDNGFQSIFITSSLCA
jgi:hypothetical protein